MNFVPVIVGLLVIAVVVLICREIACWYFKINHTITVLEEIRDLLKKEQVVVGEVKVEKDMKSYYGEIS